MMASMRRALTVRLRGELTQPALDELQRRLDLRPAGRLTDEEDADFGHRYLREDEGNFVRLGLWREAADGADWAFHLSYQNEPPDEDTLRRLRSQILDAAAAVGLAVEG